MKIYVKFLSAGNTYEGLKNYGKSKRFTCKSKTGNAIDSTTDVQCKRYK
jgi:hypothetical protein